MKNKNALLLGLLAGVVFGPCVMTFFHCFLLASENSLWLFIYFIFYLVGFTLIYGVPFGVVGFLTALLSIITKDRQGLTPRLLQTIIFGGLAGFAAHAAITLLGWLGSPDGSGIAYLFNDSSNGSSWIPFLTTIKLTAIAPFVGIIVSFLVFVIVSAYAWPIAVMFAAGVLAGFYFFATLGFYRGWMELNILVQTANAVITLGLGGYCIFVSFKWLRQKITVGKSLVTAVTYAVAVMIWLVISVFLQNASMKSESGHLGDRALLLDKKTRLGELLPDTSWVESDQRIFFINDAKALCSINANGSNLTKIADNCLTFGLLPNGRDIDIYANGSRYLMRNGSGIPQLLTTFNRCVERSGNVVVRYGGSIEYKYSPWSPDSKKLLYADTDQDANGNGRLDCYGGDFSHIYLIDVDGKSRQKINIENLYGVEMLAWDKTGDKFYFIYLRLYSSNDLRRYLCVYDLNSRQITQLDEANYSDYKKSLIKNIENDLFVNPYTVTVIDKPIEPNGDIKLSVDHRECAIYLQRGSALSKKIFHYRGRAGNGYSFAVSNLKWLPGGRYVVFTNIYYICIIDTQTEKVGILAKGDNPLWRGVSD